MHFLSDQASTQFLQYSTSIVNCEVYSISLRLW